MKIMMKILIPLRVAMLLKRGKSFYLRLPIFFFLSGTWAFTLIVGGVEFMVFFNLDRVSCLMVCLTL